MYYVITGMCHVITCKSVDARVDSLLEHLVACQEGTILNKELTRKHRIGDERDCEYGNDWPNAGVPT